MSEVLKWLEEESDRLTEESLSSADPHKTVNNSFLEGFNYALANVQGLDQLQLNENQQIVLEWLKREHFDSYIKSVLSNLYFYVNMTAIGDLENKEIQEMVNTYEKLSQEEFAQVLQVFSTWDLEQEEE